MGEEEQRDFLERLDGDAQLLNELLVWDDNVDAGGSYDEIAAKLDNDSICNDEDEQNLFKEEVKGQEEEITSNAIIRDQSKEIIEISDGKALSLTITRQMLTQWENDLVEQQEKNN
jgi:hypothetical protein